MKQPFKTHITLLEESQGWQYALKTSDQVLAILEITNPDFEWQAVIPSENTFFILSRFAYLHSVTHRLLLESPLGYAHLWLEDPRSLLVIHQLSTQAGSLKTLADQLPSLSFEEHRDLLMFLYSMGAIHPKEAEPQALLQWEFHDLLFHTRSRLGRHHYPIGGTYRFQKIGHPPTDKKIMSEVFINLPLPDQTLFQNDPPFQTVLHRRHSSRPTKTKPLRLTNVSEFLYRALKIDENHHRAYPAAGGLYELETYLIVHHCQNLPAGFYHYDAKQHRLEVLENHADATQALLEYASKNLKSQKEDFSVLIILAAQFEKITWKYESIAYSLILKNVGALFQTFYLVAAAMDLSACAIGTGNSEDFSKLAQLNYYQEGSVGEFFLGGSPTIKEDLAQLT